MNKKLLLAIILFFSSADIILAASSFNRIIYPIKIKDASDHILVQDKGPQRIVSGSPAVTEMLFAINLGDKIVGVSDDSDFPEEAKKLPKVGKDRLDIKKVLKLQPDLVIVSLEKEKNNLESLRKLKFQITVSDEVQDITLEVFAVDPKALVEVLETISTIGTITNKEHSAYSLTQRMRRRIDWVTSRAMKEKRLKALAMSSKRPLMFAGEGTILGDLAKAAGFVNIAPKGQPYMKMKRDEIRKADPDIIIASTDVARKPKDIYNKRDFRKTGANRDKRAVCIQNDLLRPGPRLVDALDQIAVSAYGWPKREEGSEIEQTKE